MNHATPRSRTLRPVTGILIVAAAALSARPLAAQLRQPPQVPLPNIIPADLQVAQLTLSTDTMRAYVVSPTGEIWFHDRARKTSARLAKAEAWDLSLAASGTALAYSRAGEKRTDHAVWILPLDPRTGLAAGPERQVSVGAADAPAISPDGKSLAFARDDATGVGQSIVVTPLGGGPERVVLRSLPAGVGFIRWTPDSKTLFVGVNPPVACDPGWSCLSLRPDLMQLKGSIQRVSAAGGAPTVVATAPGVWPGLSPDGTLLVFPDTGRSRLMVIADATGRRLQTFTSPAGGTIQGWVGKSTLLVSVPRSMARLNRYSIADGAHGVVAESADRLLEPALSPDGTLVSVVHCITTQCQLRILGPDGTLRREVALPEAYVGGNSWSPDQHWLACVTQAADQTLHVSAVEAATGRITRLGQLPAGRPSLLWHADSRTLTVAEDAVVSSTERRTMFHQFDLDGRHRELRDVALGSGQGGAMILDGNFALVYRATPAPGNQMPSVAVTRLPLDSAGSERAFSLPPAYYFAPQFSVDRRWLALRSLQDMTGDSRSFEVLRADGSGRRTVTLPFSPAFGSDNPLVLANGEQLLVRENGSSGADGGVYLATVATGRVTKLFAIPVNQRPSQFTISADGRTLVYLTAEPVAPQLLGVDLADVIRSSRP